jgi:hypothetical protein
MRRRRVVLWSRDEATWEVGVAGLALVEVLVAAGRPPRTVRVLLERRRSRAVLTAAEQRAVTRWDRVAVQCEVLGHGDLVGDAAAGLVSWLESEPELDVSVVGVMARRVLAS